MPNINHNHILNPLSTRTWTDPRDVCAGAKQTSLGLGQMCRVLCMKVIVYKQSVRAPQCTHTCSRVCALTA